MIPCIHCKGTGSLDPDALRAEECPNCEGDGQARCEKRGCTERAVGFNEDGKSLCEDCFFEETATS